MIPTPAYDEDSPPGAKRTRAPPAELNPQDTYEVSETMTFTQEGVQIKPGGMVGANSAIQLADLEKSKMLGRGISSKVWLAVHKSTGVRYALKELNAMANADTRRMAINELRIAHDHASHAEHLIHFVDAFFSGDKICICMEFADAGSFDDVIKRCGREGVPPVPLGALTLQMLHGLQYLHRELHQIHRDLKPANVMLTRRGVAKLADFGISKQLENTAAFAQTQVGTSMYMSPERFRGELYGYISDVWSVGIIVLEALLARHPFEKHGTFFALLNAIGKDPLPEAPEGTPPPIVEFVALCLRREIGGGRHGRPQVRTLVNGPWLRQVARGDARQVLEDFLKQPDQLSL